MFLPWLYSLGVREMVCVMLVCILLFIILIILTLPVYAWDGHETIAKHALHSLQEDLNQLVKKTPYTYVEVDSGPYNSKFILQYKLRERSRITAYDILVTYAQEPDWGLDTNLHLDKRQAMTGGSMGWRHQRYTLFSDLIVLGVAPQRS